MNPHDLNFDTNLDKEFKQMWQESAFPQPADASEIVRQIANTVQRFDRKIFWRNFREYAAGGIMLVVFAYGAAFDRGRIVSMIGVAAMSFVLVYMWWKHRDIKPLDPSADARAYQTALVARFDRQVQLLRNARYWYFLPLYLLILAMTTTNAMHRPAQIPPWAHAIILAASLAFVTALFIWLARLNERHAVRLLTEAKKQVESLLSESEEQE